MTLCQTFNGYSVKGIVDKHYCIIRCLLKYKLAVEVIIYAIEFAPRISKLLRSLIPPYD